MAALKVLQTWRAVGAVHAIVGAAAQSLRALFGVEGPPERLLLNGSNWRSRPAPDLQLVDPRAVKRALNVLKLMASV